MAKRYRGARVLLKKRAAAKGMKIGRFARKQLNAARKSGLTRKQAVQRTLAVKEAKKAARASGATLKEAKAAGRAAGAKWDETKHPRSASGKFARK